MTQPVVFISYSHEDEREKDELLSHLRVLKQAGLINIWSDDQIGAGTDWEQEIEQAMAQANVAILLVTANFLNSDFILGKEIPTLLKRREAEGLKVFPVIAKACAWDTFDWLSQMNVRPKNGKPVWSGKDRHVDEDLADIAREVATTVKKIISIIGLLNNGLDTEPLAENVRDLYEVAEKLRQDKAKKAIELCEKALAILETGPPGDISALEALPYARGKFNLLLASIYLDEVGELKNAEKYFIESRNEFGARKWFHLEALAYLGLASTRRKSNDLDGAREASYRAKNIVNQESMADEVDKRALAALRAAIKEEDRKIVDDTPGELTRLSPPSSHRQKTDKEIPSTPRSAFPIPSPSDTEETKNATLAPGELAQSSLPSPHGEKMDKEIPSTPRSTFPVPGPSDTEEMITASSDNLKEKALPIFNILAGEGVITAERATDLNFLDLEDYRRNSIEQPEIVNIGLTKRSRMQYVDFLLEIDKQVKTTDDLESGVYLRIQSQKDPKDLNGRAVAVLLKDDGEISVSLKTFIKAEDHYFLKAKSDSVASIVIAPYQSDLELEKITNYYAIDGERIIRKRVDEVQIIGAVYYNRPISQEPIKQMIKGYVWEIPVVSSIAAGLGVIAEYNIEGYLYLNKDEYKRADFGVRVIGDSMVNQGILSGDIALIRQQPAVEIGEIAAVVIFTAQEELGVLKQYYIYDKHKHMLHWWLKSSNPTSEHLLVIPSGVDVEAIKNLYDKETRMGQLRNPIKIYEEAEIAIAGKYIASVKESQHRIYAK